MKPLDAMALWWAFGLAMLSPFHVAPPLWIALLAAPPR